MMKKKLIDRDNNDTYSSGSFIEKDIKKDKSAKTESLIDEFYNHNKKEEASTFNLAGMVLEYLPTTHVVLQLKLPTSQSTLTLSVPMSLVITQLQLNMLKTVFPK